MVGALEKVCKRGALKRISHTGNMFRMAGSNRRDIRRIRLRDLIGPETAFKIARSIVADECSRREGAHDHDFPEMFWIESGEGLHFINGRRQEVAAGFLCMMRPRDQHNFRGQREKSLAIMNIAFPARTLEHYRRRYFPKSNSYFWTKARQPFRVQLEDSTLRWLNQSARELSAHTDSALVLDRFFAELFLRLGADSASAAPALPGWLQQALDVYRTPEHFRGGIAGFVELAGRGREHVNRSLRRHLGITTTEAVNRARLRWAADELRFTDRAILAICFDAGYGNVGHFYKLFKRQYRTAPQAWRQRHQELGRQVL